MTKQEHQNTSNQI